MTDPAGTGSTGRWPGGLEEQAALITWYIGVWNDLGYAEPEPGQHAIPPLGERSTEAITGARNAIAEVDRLVRDLHTLRGQLVSEIRENEDRARPGFEEAHEYAKRTTRVLNERLSRGRAVGDDAT